MLLNDTANVRFPLYHGTSSHYLTMFRSGISPSKWPHADDALNLLRQIWNELRALGREPDWHYVDQIINQTSGSSNWQHGDLYLTADLGTAVAHACHWAEVGGELLGVCRDGLSELASIDREKSEYLMSRAGDIQRFLRGDGRPPYL